MSEIDAEMDFASMKVNDLKRELKAKGLSVTGNKTELIERLQMSMMGSNENDDILADESELLEGDDDLGDIDLGTPTKAVAAIKPQSESSKPEAGKKKVFIKRDSALPIVTPTETKTASAVKVEITPPAKTAAVTITSPAAEKAETTEAKAVKVMSDAERAALRASRFGSAAATVASDDKKLERAKRFGLPVDTNAGSGAKKLAGDAPPADLDTLKKRADRFGQVTSKTMQQLELEEKIRKRQERFGEVKNGSSPPKKVAIEVNKSLTGPKVDPTLDEKLKKRAERFGVAKP